MTQELSIGLRARVALDKHGFQNAHSLGQNFILDDEMLTRLIDLAEVSPEETVVEIGPGAGVMTALLAERAKQVIAYEVDEKLRPVLEDVLFGLNNISVRYMDFLKSDTDEIEGDYRIVANLPYYMTSDILTKLVTAAHKPDSITVMVQQEAADRLMSAPGQKNWCAMAALVRVYGDAEILTDVPRTAFDPPPHVDSCFLRIVRRDERMPREEELTLFKLIRAAFLMRRKKLTNNLKSVYGITQEEACGTLEACGIDVNVRGEALEIGQLRSLAGMLAVT